jgi:hypothetical protein
VTKCLPQLRRFYTDHERLGPLDVNKVERPIPGPTLRATLGDVAEITFLNQIDVLDYGNSLDRYETATGDLAVPGAGCDSVTTPRGYPQIGIDSTTQKPIFDSMPNCFHGSSSANLHFHGTHTNPNSTGDDVFVEVRPSPRVNGMPVVTGASVKQDFGAFFQQCRALLQANNLNQWPVNWQSNPALQHWALGTDSPGFKARRRCSRSSMRACRRLRKNLTRARSGRSTMGRMRKGTGPSTTSAPSRIVLYYPPGPARTTATNPSWGKRPAPTGTTRISMARPRSM